ncbi:transmembrane protein 201 [Ctenocephalides felis]|uniref:transmembrane protein 201 n=1 Tax=Ctenocephalides felis TaxID=7515 RepID=UPI000E6E2F0F|nr:transmembrane protein 201 [Ctenocephalides felis]
MVPFILTLFVASIFFILIVASCVYNLYVFIRKKIPVHVNCWFCNENSYVCFKSKDSWVCSGCQQYNGFDENGDYNCDISNQYFDFLNPTVYCQYEKSGDLNKSNQLCTSCNYKQAEKVQLIAEFVPKNVHHYDYEVEEYIKKLEDSYQVCKKCSKVVDKAVAESKTLLLEQYLTFLRSKGLNISNLKSTDTNFNYYISTTTNSVIFVLSGIYLINLCYLLNNQNSRIYNKFYPYLLNMADNIILYFKILNETYGSMILLENIHNSLTTKYDFFFLNISSLYIPAFETISY